MTLSSLSFRWAWPVAAVFAGVLAVSSIQAQDGADAEISQEEQAVRAAEAKADDLPRVKLSTSKGDMVLELYENEAPNTVANFISLVDKGFYDGVKFHRVLEDFMAQGGDPTGTGAGGPGYKIACECYAENARKHFPATLSMAHAGRDTGGSQFFITFTKTSFLDGKHTVFGRVIEGQDVLAKIQRIDPSRPRPGVTADTITKATVIRKRDHEYKPKKVGE
ncbi:MAG TPA: peptidylprolyl isomerase [Pirellulales bacterium]